MQFPVLLNEVAAAAAVSLLGSDSEDSADDSGDTHERQEQALVAREFAQCVQNELEKFKDQQSDVRCQMLKEVEDAQRSADQRVYRRQLTAQIAKRKQRQHEMRTKAKYETYIATVERKRVEPTTTGNDSLNGPATTGARADGTTPGLLRWEKAAQPRRGGRPSWVAQEVSRVEHSYDSQQRMPGRRDDESASVLLQQCQLIHDSPESAARQRRKVRLDVLSRPATAP